MHCEWEILGRGSEWFREYLEPSFEKTKSVFNMIPRFAEVLIQMSNRIISLAFSDFVCCDEMPSIRISWISKDKSRNILKCVVWVSTWQCHCLIMTEYSFIIVTQVWVLENTGISHRARPANLDIQKSPFIINESYKWEPGDSKIWTLYIDTVKWLSIKVILAIFARLGDKDMSSINCTRRKFLECRITAAKLAYSFALRQLWGNECML